MTTPRYASDDLLGFMTDVLVALGLHEHDAALGAAVLHDADLAGVDTHGIVNLARHTHYAPGLRSGFVDPRGSVTVLRDAPVAAAWDSGRGFGPVVAHRAMSAAIDKAEATGVGMVTVRDARHFGANGYFAEMAANRGLMAMVATDTPVNAFPPGGIGRVVGPCPFAFAAPLEPGAPLVVDISMTAAAGSRVILAERAGTQVPEGWVVDAAGRPSTDPAVRSAGGALELLGGQVAGHKGYGLALMVESLTMLSGNGAGLFATMPDWTQGQWFAAWRPDLFIDPDELRADMRRLASAIHDTPTRDGVDRVLVPGERRAASRAERRAIGIPIEDWLADELRAMAEGTGAELPAPLPHATPA